MNTNGTFFCTCDEGYQLSDDGTTCRDIDECMTHMHGCVQVCVNTAGGFRCECNTGFQLNRDNTTCLGTYVIGYMICDWLRWHVRSNIECKTNE